MNVFYTIIITLFTIMMGYLVYRLGELVIEIVKTLKTTRIVLRSVEVATKNLISEQEVIDEILEIGKNAAEAVDNVTEKVVRPVVNAANIISEIQKFSKEFDHSSIKDTLKKVMQNRQKKRHPSEDRIPSSED